MQIEVTVKVKLEVSPESQYATKESDGAVSYNGDGVAGEMYSIFGMDEPVETLKEVGIEIVDTEAWA